MNKNREKRYSVGVACVRFNEKREAEILLIQKRFSYAYSQFAFGDWGAIKRDGLEDCIRRLLNNMTIEEKIHILSLDFDKIWYRIWLRDYKPKSYFIVKQKFEKYFCNPEGSAALKLWLAEAEHGGEIWEIPKGRKNRGESEINAAVREFEEETQIPKDLYNILFGLKTKDSITDDGITYISTYYIALANKKFEPKISVCDNQINEIINIKWCTKNDEEVKKRPNLELNVSRIIKIVKKYIKGMYFPIDSIIRPPLISSPNNVLNNKFNDNNIEFNNDKKSIIIKNRKSFPPGFSPNQQKKESINKGGTNNPENIVSLLEEREYY